MCIYAGNCRRADGWDVTATVDALNTCAVLVVDDSQSDFAALEANLRSGTLADARIDRAATVSKAIDRLASGTYAAVLVDLALQGADGWDGFDKIAGAAGRAAVLVLIGWGDQGLAAEALRRGAQDCLVKGDRRVRDVSQKVEFAIRRQSLLADLQDARAGQVASTDRFLSRVSHELRSPLAVVKGFASLLSEGVGGPVSEQQQEYLMVLMQSATQLGAMVDDLLAVSRAQRGNVAIECGTVQLTELLDEMVRAFRTLAQSKNVDLHLDIVQPLPEVVADPARVREVLGNLLDNALKFTPSGGTISVSAAREAGMVRVTVRDTGCGIGAADLPHIFEQFYQSESRDAAGHGGLGLGLFVSHDLITRQGGEMCAESEPGHGASISFTLHMAVPSQDTSTCRERSVPTCSQ